MKSIIVRFIEETDEGTRRRRRSRSSFQNFILPEINRGRTGDRDDSFFNELDSLKTLENERTEYKRELKVVNVMMQKVSVEDDWFEVYRLPYQVFAITEPKHFQEVQSFFIKGEKYSVLLDTGMGIGNIKNVVNQLGDGKVVVVNSHFHFDHVAENHRFYQVYLYNEKHAIQKMKEGCRTEEMAYNIQKAMFFGEPPRSFDQQQYAIPPVEPLLMEDGDVFDLGNRKLQVIHTPGHTQDSIMLWDQENGLLFSGDSLYKGPIYLHFHSPTYGYSNIREYIRSMKKIGKLSGSLRYVYCSHNEPVVDPSMIKEVVDAMESLERENQNLPGSCPGLHAYDKDENKLIQHDFEHFSVILPKT